METFSKSTEETKKIAEGLLKDLVPTEKKAITIGLFGDLGSGKTTFVQFIAENLGIKENITSPTFVIEKIYEIENKIWPKKLIHIDAYRLTNGEELKKLGFEDVLNDRDNLIMIEWPENVSGVLPKHVFKIEFEFVDETTRKIKI